jgi:hypothetical protein
MTISVVPFLMEICCRLEESGDRGTCLPRPICIDDLRSDAEAQSGILTANLKSVPDVMVYFNLEEKGYLVSQSTYLCQLAVRSLLNEKTWREFTFDMLAIKESFYFRRSKQHMDDSFSSSFSVCGCNVLWVGLRVIHCATRLPLD